MGRAEGAKSTHINAGALIDGKAPAVGSAGASVPGEPRGSTEQGSGERDQDSGRRLRPYCCRSCAGCGSGQLCQVLDVNEPAGVGAGTDDLFLPALVRIQNVVLHQERHRALP